MKIKKGWAKVSTRSFYGYAARSKDCMYRTPHRLYVYAVGLRIKGVSRQTIANCMIYKESGLSQYAHWPATSISVPSGYRILAGGGTVYYYGSGGHFSYSFPSGNKWLVQARDHISPEITRIKAYAIGIKDYIPGFGYLDVDIQSFVDHSKREYLTNRYLSIENRWAVGSTGAYSFFNGTGRLLRGFKPYVVRNNFEVRASSKDCKRACSGGLNVYATILRKRP